MFIGHYGVALGAHALFPQVPLPALVIATQAIDIVWAGLVLTGAEKVAIRPGATATTPLDLYHMPYSHSFGGAIVISLACALLAGLWGLSASALAVVFAVAFSHWLLDLAVHDRTFIFVPGRTKIGFGVWQNRPVSVVLEMSLILAGILLYQARFVSGEDGAHTAFWVFSAAAMLVQALTFFGPPPKSVKHLVLTMLTLFAAFTVGSFWLDQSAGW